MASFSIKNAAWRTDAHNRLYRQTFSQKRRSKGLHDIAGRCKDVGATQTHIERREGKKIKLRASAPCKSSCWCAIYKTLGDARVPPPLKASIRNHQPCL